FLQAEDGIRDFHVTGVQTCALPIFEAEVEAEHEHASPEASADDDIPVLDQTDVIVDDPSAEHEGAPPLLTEPLEAPSDAQVAPLDEVDIDGHRVSASLYRIFLGEADRSEEHTSELQ